MPNRHIRPLVLFALVLFAIAFSPIQLLAQVPATDPSVAGAVDAAPVSIDPALFDFLPANWMPFVLLALAVVEVARRVAAVIPSKSGAQSQNVVERLLRFVVDLLAGLRKNGDQSLRRE